MKEKDILIEKKWQNHQYVYTFRAPNKVVFPNHIWKLMSGKGQWQSENKHRLTRAMVAERELTKNELIELLEGGILEIEYYYIRHTKFKKGILLDKLDRL